MKSYRTLTLLFIKQQLLGRVFPLCAAIFLSLFTAFSLLCPEKQPISAQVGLSYDKSDNELQTALEPLFDSDELRFLYYSPDETDSMRRDIMLGKLHCGYLISDDEKSPITVLENDGSILTPATDEIVFSAWFTARISDIAPKLYGGEKHAELIAEVMQRQSALAKPLTINIEIAKKSAEQQQYPTLAQLIYAVSISLCLCCAAFCGIFSPKNGRQTVSLLCATASRKSVLLCMALAQAVMFFALLILCELILAALGVAVPFSIPSRLLAAAVLAVGCAAITHLFANIKPRPVYLCGMIIWSVGSVLFSGAIISPELFGAAEWLKILSPAWLILKFMAVLS
ncbi:MAG: hypothetical protein J6A76_02835 [Oscillospiraceae bacterium]|nr:hypothetical protein [Oscillospiraceae bacterium]